MRPNINIVCLVSIGRHPQSGRARRAEQDGRAVELGLKLADSRLTLVHAGDADDPVLRQYTGMGLDGLTVLTQNKGDDALPALVTFFKANRQNHSRQIVLTGVHAENGESSGMLPYLLAEQLGWPLVPRIADIVRVDEFEAEVLLALPRGQRRAVTVALPFIASVDAAAQEARQSAFARGLRATVTSLDGAAAIDELASQWHISPAKPKPKRLKVVKAKTAADRMKAATAKPVGSGGKVLKNESIDEQAQAIFDVLIEEKVIR
ncbi:electron transfer flavoprotein subunit beta [Marinomonas sp. IMCC 4694]|uniref:electron transfer flavoprotein subunit beta n=1 Tax=Marinomonas sp. IMCC 4694 TaxID=2605432 RepID=UPI0011E749C5|nr:electron transfer flavoprotein subunit beta [Marinomonas sp. IMCC 4694]TYL48112.1 electron transfer flavoprotein subunit beta [Marinomonas sp. IMCC 4694]